MNTAYKIASLILFSICILKVQALEYQIEPKNLLIFSSSVIKVKTCSKCETINFKVTPKTKYYHFGQEIDLSKATELYLRKNYSRVSLHTPGEDTELLFMVFGIFPEVQKPINAVTHSQAPTTDQ